MNIELQVGKKYRARNGEIAEVTGVGDPPCGQRADYYAFKGVLEGVGPIQWSAEGRYWKIDEDEWDLIEEVPAQPAAQAEQAEPECAPAPAGITLEVGKWYRARDGRVAEVTGVGDGAFYNDFTGKVGHFYCQWNSAGVFDGEQGETVFDLIEEIPAPVAEAAAEMEFEPGDVSPALSDPVDLAKYGVREFPDLGVKLDGDTEKVVAHWDREGFLGIEQPEEDRQFSRQANRDLHEDHLANTNADRFATYARAIMFIMLGVAAVVFAIGTSVQA